MNKQQDIEEWRKEVADVQPLSDVKLHNDDCLSNSPLSSHLTSPSTLARELFTPQGEREIKPISMQKRRIQTEIIKHVAVRYPIYERETPTVRLAKIDSSIMRQLRLGRMNITHKLDLHDMNAAMAYETLHNFLRITMQDGAKIALIITGKGSKGGFGANEGFVGELRRNLPRWCIEPTFQPMVVALQQALPHHGGVGAFYVQIRSRG